MSVADWLKGLDLGQYAQAFADNDIDLVLAATLTEADLKEIGVASLGHRRKLLAAAAALTAKPPAPQPTPSPPPPGQDAERRPITVMFCDLVGSTSLAAKLDPEDWRNLVGGYLDAASASVTSLGGHVLKKLGDGLMALFGYPQAQENDGERAVRAALAIQRALADLNARNAATGAPECTSWLISLSSRFSFRRLPGAAVRRERQRTRVNHRRDHTTDSLNTASNTRRVICRRCIHCCSSGHTAYQGAQTAT